MTSLFPDQTPLEGVRAALDALRDRALACKLCKLHETRTKVVFGEGNYNSPDVCFVGEGPGANEDESGRPFVGRAGELLDGMIKAMGMSREQVYIVNCVGCRPPENRKPEPDELKACSQHWIGQLRLVKPKIIVALGATAAQTLANSTKSIGELRGRWLEWKDQRAGGVVAARIKIRATYHPAYLLRMPAKKTEAWEDLQMVVKWLRRTE